jgi:hypothetical protein
LVKSKLGSLFLDHGGGEALTAAHAALYIEVELP